jgi:hypothetical protein
VGVTPQPDVVVAEQDGEAFLLHVPSGRYFGLNASGLVVWRALEAGTDPVAELRTAFPSVDEALARADVATIESELISAGLAAAGR